MRFINVFYIIFAFYANLHAFSLVQAQHTLRVDTSLKLLF